MLQWLKRCHDAMTHIGIVWQATMHASLPHVGDLTWKCKELLATSYGYIYHMKGHNNRLYKWYMQHMGAVRSSAVDGVTPLHAMMNGAMLPSCSIVCRGALQHA